MRFDVTLNKIGCARHNIQSSLMFCSHLHYLCKKIKKEIYEKETYTIKMARYDAHARGGYGDAIHGVGTKL